MEIHNPRITGSLYVSGSVTTTGNQTVNGNLSVIGNLTAQQFIVSSSVTYLTTSFSSGSTKFGDTIDDTHQFTGSLNVTGSQTINGTLGVSIGGSTELSVQQAGVTLGNIVTDAHRVTGSLNVSGSIATTGAATFSNSVTIEGNGSTIRSGNELRFNRADNAIYTRMYDAGSLAANGFTLDNTNAEGFHFKNNGTTIMRMNSAGNVGINTNSPFTQGSGGNSLELVGGTYGQFYVSANSAAIRGTVMARASTLNDVYIATITNSPLLFGTNDTERMRITSGGNVGIGTTSPVTAGGSYVGLNISGASGSSLVLTSSSSHTYLYAINATNDFAIENAGSQIFRAGSAERMRINSSGNFDYGGYNVQSSNNATYRQAFYGGLSIMWRNAEDTYLDSNHTYSSTNTNVATYTSTNGIGRLSIYGGVFTWDTYNGSVTAGTAYTLTNAFGITKAGAVTASGDITAYSSDQRLKKNVENIPNAIDKILSLNGITYDWNEKALGYGFVPDNLKHDVGLLAQQVQSVLPEAVTLAPFDRDLATGESKSGENYLTVRYDKLVALLVEGTKEQQKEINELKELVKQLINR